MKEYIIYDKTGLTERLHIKTLEYNGVFMGDKSITCTYKSPVVIPFAIGDYVEYRGEKFVLDYDPSDSKEAEVRRSGDAITYNLTFHPESHVELQNCDFCDYVLYDNQLHYSSSPKFSFIGTAHDLADRIKANLDRLYPGQWTIEIDSSVVTEDKNIEIENTSCWNAVVLFNKEYGLNFTVSGRTVKVGFPPVVVKHTFNYGINNGLYKIERNVNSDEAVITRLKAYGADRNIPTDYNKLSTDIVPKKNLMLPGYKETGVDYIDSDNISIYGIRPQSVVFDDIYPSIEGVEVDGIGRIDEIVSAEQVTADTESNNTFKINIKDIGFDINDYLVSGETATISIKNGSLLGYEFEIVKVEKLDTGGYELTLNKSKRDNWQVPNKDQNLQSGNRFVLLHIRMPEKYVTYAEEKLLKRAKEFLARYDHVTYTYDIGVDEIFMARNISLYEDIMEGDKLPFYDANLSIDGEIIIQSLVITEGENIPTYKITLSDQPSSGTIDKIWDAINNIKNQGSVSGGYYGGGGMSPEELNKKYLHKDRPDQTDYLLGLNGGATFGTYIGGFLGSGARINEKGEIEARSLQLWEFLNVPELRFNRVDVIAGETWNAIAFGLIESVDTVNQIVTLKLEDGELSGMHLNDFCRGIFHNLTGNEVASGTDSAGFKTMAGFSTTYFTPVEIIDNAHFRYELKPGTTVHPCASMKYAVYGNPTIKERQQSSYSTRTYIRFLRNVNTWEIHPDKNVSSQWGDLSDLTINGESLKEGSIYLNNVYFGGNVWNVPGLDGGLKGLDAYSVVLSSYSAVYNTKDGLTEQVDVVSGGNNVVTGSDQVVTQDFRITTKIQVTKGTELLRYSTVLGTGKYLVNAVGTGCTFTVTDGLVVVHSITEEKAEIKLEINCEGLATYEQVFTVVRVIDGVDGTDVEWIFKRSPAEANKPSRPATSENTDDYVPNGWTDDPVGPDINNPFEWSCKREKRNGLWGAFSDVFLWSKWGKDGKETESVYAQTKILATPSYTWSDVDNYVPSGWTPGPQGVTSEYIYEWIMQRKKVNGSWSYWSAPAIFAKWSKDGTDGTDGTDGLDGWSIFRWYKISASRPSTPTSAPPSGWSVDPPTGEGIVWATECHGRINENGSVTYKDDFITPVQVTGPKGDEGTRGPFMTFRRKYDPTKQYTGSTTHVDAVYTEDSSGNKTYWVAKPTAGIFSAKVPNTSSAYWEAFQGQFESIATGLALIEEANIAGWWFSDLVIESQNRNCVIDGNADDHPRIALGANYANRDNAPTRMYEDGRVYFENGTFGGKVVSSLNGNRVIIDPEDQSLKMINSYDKEVFSVSFQDTAGQQSFPEINMYMHTADGDLIKHIRLNAGGFYIMSGADGSNTVSLTPSSLTVPNLPSIDPKVKGMLWRDGTTLKVSLG